LNSSNILELGKPIVMFKREELTPLDPFTYFFKGIILTIIKIILIL